MDVKEILQITDQLIFSQTGKHLDNIQEAVVKGVWEGQTYGKIADECHRSESRIRDVGYKLCEILSRELGEDINKSNFRSAFERLQKASCPIIIQNNNHNFNFCSPYYHLSKDAEDNTINGQKLFCHDLKLAPKITYFCERETELQTLSYWITNQNVRLISILGLPGIGKTTLVKQFVDINLEYFDAVIWKSVKLFQSLDSIITEISTAINSEPILADNKFTQLFNTLNQKKCLIILDDVQELFANGQFAGQYKSKYKDYQTLFAKMAEIENQSSLILISQEQCREMVSLDDDLYPVKCLELEGLKNTDILRSQGLKNEKLWSNLIDLYEGNPAYLKDIASLIKNVFLGNVSEFLNEDRLIITEDMKSGLTELFNKLSPIEKQIVLKFNQSAYPISIENLKQGLELSSMDAINGLQSLIRRYLIKKIAGEKVLFDLSLVIREYIKSYCQS